MKRYYSFRDYCVATFGRKLYKVPLNTGLGCPNRDGTIGTGGCIFCDEGGSGDFAIDYSGQTLSKADFKWNHTDAEAGDYIAYFQAYTNTYAPVPVLKRLFESALRDPLFAGISIATRPDCLDDSVMELFHQLRVTYPDKFIWAELGLQTVNEKTARFIHRGYPLPVYDDAVKKLHAEHIPVITHVIIGLPDETEADVHQTIRHLNRVKTDGVKLQLLHYLKGTELGRMYEENPSRFHVLSKDEYVRAIGLCIGWLDEHIVIHRLTGDGNGALLIEPLWSRDKRSVLNAVEHELKVRNITQGCRKEYSYE